MLMSDCQAADSLQGALTPTTFELREFTRFVPDFTPPVGAPGDADYTPGFPNTPDQILGDLFTRFPVSANVALEFIGLGGGYLAYDGKTLGVEIVPSKMSVWTFKWLGTGPSSRITLTKEAEAFQSCVQTPAPVAQGKLDRWPVLYQMQRHAIQYLTLTDYDLDTAETVELGSTWRFSRTAGCSAGWVLQNAQTGMYVAHPANGRMTITDNKQKAAYLSIWTQSAP